MPLEVPDEFRKTQQLMGGLEPLELISGLGALQLMPANAARLLRLETASALAATVKWNAEHRRPRRRDWQVLLDAEPLGGREFSRAEDPFNNVFCEDFPFFGGNYRVLSGPIPRTTYILRRLAEALFLDRDPELPREYLDKVYSVFHGVLVLSNRLCHGAGLERGEAPPPRPGAGTVIPDRRRLQDLSNLVALDEGELGDVLGEYGLPITSLAPLTRPLREAAGDRWHPFEAPMVLSPIFYLEERWVVALPCSLLSYLRHEILAEASRQNLTETLVERYTKAVRYDVTRSLTFMGNLPLRSDDIGGEEDEAYFLLDVDKVIRVQFLVDRLEDYDNGQPFGSWDTSALLDEIEERAKSAEERLKQEQPDLDQVLHIFVVVGFERTGFFGFGSSSESEQTLALFLSGDDLRTIALLEKRQPLALWQFASAYNRIRETTKIFAWSTLDEYGQYRSHHRSYYFSEEGRADFMSIGADGIAPLRAEVLSKYDLHAVGTPKGGGVVEVALLFGDKAAPVYAPFPPSLGDELRYFIELEQTSVWVISRIGASNGRMADLVFLLVDAVAYWIWQCAPSISDQLTYIADRIEAIVIDLNVEASEAWWTEEPPEDGSEPVRVSLTADGGILLEISHRLGELLGGSNNAGERYLVDGLLQGFLDLAAELGQTRDGTDAVFVETARERHAPLGKKKKLMFLSGLRNPELIDLGLPPERLVQEFDEQVMMDELGAHISSDLGIDIGEIEAARVVEVLNWSVDWLFGQLEGLVKQCAAPETIQMLVAMNERLGYENAQLRLTLPTRVECFSSIPTIAQEFASRLPILAKASVATRFLVEYVATCPPAGNQAYSMSRHDRLLAIASLIVHYANLSDLAHYGLSDVQLALLGSGRLGVGTGDYELAQQLHLSTFSLGQVRASFQRFDAYWPEEVANSASTDFSINDLDRAASSEFGLSFTQLVEFMSASVEIGLTEFGGRPCILPLDEFRSKLGERLDISIELIDAALELLSLKPREAYLKPPEPFDTSDVYPWKHNRALSYLRRPLIRLNSEEREDVVWGTRQMHLSAIHLLELITSGRLKAKSPSMKRYMSSVQASDAEMYNDEVFEFFKGLDGYQARKQVKKVAGIRIQRPNGEPIGDIDVLAVDKRRRVIYSLETKSLKMAATPRDISAEVAFLVGGEVGKPSTAKLHSERESWIRGNKKRILDWLGIDSRRTAKWDVVSYIVVDADLIGPYIVQSPIPILTFDALRERIHS